MRSARMSKAVLAGTLLQLLIGCAVLVPAPVGAVLQNSTLTKWLTLTQQVVRNLRLTNQVSSHIYGLSSYGFYRAYKLASEARGPNAPHPPLAAAFAAHGVLSRFAPQLQPTLLDNPLWDDIYNSPFYPPVSNAVRDASERIGVGVAVDLTGPTTTDVGYTLSFYRPPPADQAPYGVYTFTPGQTFLLYPEYANASTLVYPTAYIPRLAAPYIAGIHPINSSAYLAEKEYTRQWGSVNSTLRDQYQTDTAYFWLGAAQFATSLGSPALGGILQNIALQLLPATTSELSAARTFAALGTSAWDVTVTLWYIRYKALRSRPITDIRRTDDPTWTPLLGTPQHPEYPSAHAGVFNAGLQVILRALNVTVNDTVPSFTINADGWDGIAPRTYTNLRVPQEEAFLSRIYAGAHWNQSCADSASFATILGDYVYDNIDRLKLGRQRPAWDYSV